MAENPIELVRQAESEADETLRTAAQQAEQMVDDAHGEVVRLARTAEDDARRAAADKIAEAHKASQRALEEAMAGLDGEMVALQEKARAAQPKAIEMIIDALA
ncbi:MAG: hypothetical protein AB7V55_06130 [Oscillospiraceae bacterium]